eukprot:47990-Eustigmatos_ZCMA.PRE.1
MRSYAQRLRAVWDGMGPLEVRGCAFCYSIMSATTSQPLRNAEPRELSSHPDAPSITKLDLLSYINLCNH